MANPDPPRIVVTVAPTETTVVSIDVRDYEVATLQVDNLDAMQTFAGVVERRIISNGDWSPSTMGDFSAIAALDSVTADLDVSGTGYLRLVGTMSGAGGDVAYAIRVGRRK